jgi:4-hydroxy-2-oxoheptanedioate aldolase
MSVLVPNGLKKAMKDGRKLAGYWLTLASPMATEIAAGAGYDWLLVDMEHTPNDLTDVVDHLRAAAAGGPAEVVVRVPWNDMVMVKRLLDSGVRSLMFPYVQNADDARRAVESTRYPPNGVRGFAGSSRATNFGRIKDYAARADETICVILQIESPEAVGNIPDMAKIDGVDCMFIGPNDLAANMGFLAKASAPEVKDTVLKAMKAIQAGGVCPGLLNFDPAEAKKMFDAGFGLIAVGGDTTTLTSGADSLAAMFK